MQKGVLRSRFHLKLSPVRANCEASGEHGEFNNMNSAFHVRKALQEKTGRTAHPKTTSSLNPVPKSRTPNSPKLNALLRFVVFFCVCVCGGGGGREIQDPKP